MRSIAAVLIALALASLIIVSSSGTFVSFEAAREVKVQVVPHEKEYIGFTCEDGYGAVVEVTANSETDLDALTVRNYLSGNRDVTILLYPDYSGIPGNAEMFTETEDGAPRIIASGDEYTFFGNVTVGDVAPGEYIVPMDMYAEWDDGDAAITPCPIKLIVKSRPGIEKRLLSGELEVPAHTYQQWTFRISVTNPDVARDLTIKDVIPGEFEIDSIVPSTGTYSVLQTGAAHHITWNVELDADESAYMDVTIHTKLNPAGKQEFTTCDRYYSLNDGAEIEGYNVRSENITVYATCEDNNDCHVCIMSKKLSGPGNLRANTPADYHSMIFVKNTGDEKDLTVTQNIGKHFAVQSYSQTRGSVSLTNLPNGQTLVTWTLHLAPGESARLDLYEHTDGISVHGGGRYVLFFGKPCVAGCGCAGCPRYIHVFKCGCNSQDDNPAAVTEVNEIYGIESGSDTEACGR